MSATELACRTDQPSSEDILAGVIEAFKAHYAEAITFTATTQPHHAGYAVAVTTAIPNANIDAGTRLASLPGGHQKLKLLMGRLAEHNSIVLSDMTFFWLYQKTVRVFALVIETAKEQLRRHEGELIKIVQRHYPTWQELTDRFATLGNEGVRKKLIADIFREFKLPVKKWRMYKARMDIQDLITALKFIQPLSPCHRHIKDDQ